MFTLFAQFYQWITRPAAPAAAGHAHLLLERADAREGLDPQQARELRAAAHAYLRVVR